MGRTAPAVQGLPTLAPPSGTPHADRDGLKYTKYGFLVRRSMRWISRREAGDTDMHCDYEYTDWDAVDRLAGAVEVLARDAPATQPVMPPTTPV